MDNENKDIFRKLENPAYTTVAAQRLEAIQMLKNASGYIVISLNSKNILQIAALLPDSSSEMKLLAHHLQEGIDRIKSNND